jgi:hypothetical protein
MSGTLYDTALAQAAEQTTSAKDYAWWSVLRHGGCLIAPSRLCEYFPPRPERPLTTWAADRLRRAVTGLQKEGGKEALDRILDTVLVDLLGLGAEFWSAGSNIDATWSVKTLTGEVVKPRRIWQEPGGGVLSVFVADESVARGCKPPALGIGRGRRSMARTVEWLRHKGQKVGLLTNGFQWRLIHAGADFDAWCEWDIDTWFVEGEPGPPVDALRLLLGRDALAVSEKDKYPRLVEAILATRRGQAELSAALGERVRQAVELLLRESSRAIDELRDEAGSAVSNRDVYIAAVRLVMRLVVLLFAESRDLLPRNDPLYFRSYSLQRLIELLDSEGAGDPMSRLRDRHGAWPRLLSLFRLLFHGSTHEQLVISRYGGGLFTPGEAASADPVLRALAALESPHNEVCDGVVATMLEHITRAPVKVRQGRTVTQIMAPIDFSQFDTEYIGILYQGLLDYELRCVEPGVPMVFLNLGDQPALPLNRLEEMDDKALAGLIEKLKVKTAAKSDSEDTEEEEVEEAEEAESVPTEYGEEELPADLPIVAEDQKADEYRSYRQRAMAWARRSVEAGKLVPKYKGKPSPEKQRAYEADVDRAARSLIVRLVLPGEYYLVRFGGTRKGSGTFYTKPGLTVPTIRRTLEPLAYEEGRPRPPADILALKVCDSAAGSGSFLVGVLRYLTNALYESVIAHGWIVEYPDGSIRWGNPDPPIPEWFVKFMEDVPGINEPAPRGETRSATETSNPEDRIRARLRRVIVERCIYGVELDPLAVELARLALWVETMDPFLPFSFLDHKIKCGNSLVGCWFDRFQDYPAMAWEREGGDKSHTTGVHFQKEEWTKAIKKVKAEVVKPELAGLIESMPTVVRGFHGPDRVLTAGGFAFDIGVTAEQAHEHLVASYRHLHERMNASLPEEQARIYRDEFVDNAEVQRLRFAFDLWCSVWFWPADKLDIAPTPSKFFNPPAETRTEVERLAREMRFFHWEIEFPDVFTGANPGFSAMVGNPPWETLQPLSKEWFSNHDPLYRAYGNEEAKGKQKEYFAAEVALERSWLSYCARFKALTCWHKNAANPTEKKWPQRHTCSFADPAHPFLHQGEGKPYTYKMFLELAHALVRNGGLIGLIVPSGIYTDRGSAALRDLFLHGCCWKWLFSFENRQKIFEIHGQFKFCPVIVEKGGTTDAILASFMHHDLEDWEDAEKHVLPYPRKRVEQFSPKSKAILEIQSPRDFAILEKMYANGVLLGDDGPNGWGIRYAQGDFNMTSDSKLFPPRPQWETKGYVPDEYGHWLKGKWRLANDVFPGRLATDLWREAEWVRSRDGMQVIAIGEIEDVALPLIQGAMLQQFDWSQKGWISGTGLRAVWNDIAWGDKHVSPQFLMSLSDFLTKGEPAAKPSVRRIGRNTDSRMMISGFVPAFPCGDVASVLQPSKPEDRPAAVGVFNSFACDQIVRTRCGGTHVDYHYLAEIPVPFPGRVSSAGLSVASLRLAGPHPIFSDVWLRVVASQNNDMPWRHLWALTAHERLRLRCILDALVAHLYGLDEPDFRHILRDCDHPVELTTSKDFTRGLDPKGFWRVDKNSDVELRHPVLAQVALADLQALIRNHGEDEAIRQFLGTGPDDGWMLPETLRLANYDLGHDERARHHQPVAARLGPRFYDFQLTQPAEESWAECRMHAERIGCIRNLHVLDRKNEGPKGTKGDVKKPISSRMQQPELF